MKTDAKPAEKFNGITGGFSEEELKDASNRERLEFMVKSKWFDATGEEDEEFTLRVADYIWKKLERDRETREMHTDIAKR